MEQYYFIQQKGVKKGPFKLNELKTENIFFDELVWRSDNDKWKKASEFEELSDIFLIKPPLTPLEIKKNQINEEFIKKVLPNTLGVYLIIFLMISMSSFIIANNTWNDVKKKYIINNIEAGKNSNDVKKQNFISNKSIIDSLAQELKKLRVELKVAENEINLKQIKNKSHDEIMNSSDKRDGIQYLINTIKLDSEYRSAINSNLKVEQELYGLNSTQEVIQPIHKIPVNVVALENVNGLQQSFLIRPLYAYFSKIYLTREEQNSSGKLFFNITLSTFSLLLLVSIINLVILYLIKVSKTNN